MPKKKTTLQTIMDSLPERITLPTKSDVKEYKGWDICFDIESKNKYELVYYLMTRTGSRELVVAESATSTYDLIIGFHVFITKLIERNNGIEVVVGGKSFTGKEYLELISQY